MNLFIINFVYHKTDEETGIRYDFYYVYRIRAENEVQANREAIKRLKEEHNIDFNEINKKYENGDYIMRITTKAEIESGVKYNSIIARIDVIGDGDIEINDFYNFLAEGSNVSESLRAYAKSVIEARENAKKERGIK